MSAGLATVSRIALIRARGPWRGIEPVEFATLEWVDWFNNRRRRHSALEMLTPVGYEARHKTETAA
jgi:putative transposase